VFAEALIWSPCQQMINHLNTNVVEGIADINDKFDDKVRMLDKQSS
jgi:hypothetical protein